ncbi:hypothetical protein [uncultured Winogradskyella sp.]|uniref:hypothetical protein n=1 Tax=uncultured Winogradskyella sp. TaxID=395353 RepID=UPI0026137955|nr:hypothetical protein [uncultured Winogradskyella sp.]
MKTPLSKVLIRLSILIIILAIIASFSGLFAGSIYRDNEFVKAVWIGNDLITICIIIPTMIMALFFANHHSVKAQLILMGTFWYMLYNYIFYMYGAAFNELFLIYVSIFTLSAYALILALMYTDFATLKKYIIYKTPVKWISGFMIFFALCIGGLWVAQSLSFAFTNELPIGISQTDHPTSVVFATDLSLLVSTLVVGAILLWNKKIWGYVISIIVMTKCVIYPLVLLVGSIFAFKRTGILDTLLPFYMLLWLGALATFIYLLKYTIKQKFILKS